ncbi:IS256 family transposase [Ligilactobacillus sp. WILCCON 0076]|uniref:Mutator family transposase n=1 Tax=Ligilactobacillus ubinensis TaxID=2876789 RepID=A0A9X2JM25_9LACO|nr:IS256 family transposase [Ligilactobacillus ubinensis]MCP0887474.1 IS256 family transposase [Ligilactobacillus ubinensis]
MDQFTKDLTKTLLSNGDVKELFRQQLETAINHILQVELTALLGYDLYDRSGFNSGNSRNGQYYRLIDSEYEKLKIIVPRDRQGKFHNHLLPAYSRRQDALETTIIQLYSKGVTTREIADLIEEMYGTYYSATTVSNITAQVTKQIESFHQRTIKANYVCLFLDATYLPLRRDSVQKEAVYVALGITATGTKEVLDYRITPSENSEVWSEMAENLKQRGLKQVQLIIADGMVGLQPALLCAFPKAKFQRCLVHVMRNISSNVRLKDRESILNDFKQLHSVSDITAGRQLLNNFYDTWEKKYSNLIKKLKSIENELLAFLSFPLAIRPTIYSTNILESLNKKIKRKTKPKEQFPNEKSLDNFIGVQILNYNENNFERIHRGFGQVKDTLESLFD